MKGIIALDIDGTTTDDTYHVPDSVVQFLKSLVLDGWEIVFITGRTHKFASRALDVLDFHYYLAVQNGAIIIEMPSSKIASKKYVGSEVLSQMDNICLDEPTDYVIAAGFEYQDKFYYRPNKFSSELLHYLENRYVSQKEDWIPVESFQTIELKSYASIKCFGFKESTFRISERVEKELGLHAPNIRDPFNEGHYVVQATHPEVNKGEALEDVKQMLNWSGVTIAAGDDLNDISMFEHADIAVAMGTAPEEILKLGDVIAPPASEMGIIAGLEEAIRRVNT